MRCQGRGRAGAGLVQVFRQGCPRSRLHFIPFLAKTPGCRNKPAAALPDVASSCCPFPQCPQPPGCRLLASSSTPRGVGSQQCPQRETLGMLGTHRHWPRPPCPSLTSPCRGIPCRPPPAPARDTDTGTSKHSCVSETGYREISAFYKRNYNKSVAPPPLARAGSLPRAPGRCGGAAQPSTGTLHRAAPGEGQRALYLQDCAVTCSDGYVGRREGGDGAARVQAWSSPPHLHAGSGHPPLSPVPGGEAVWQR